MERSKRARYTQEFKQEAVGLVESGQSIAATARSLELVEQMLFNWIKAHRQGKLLGSPEKPVSAEQMEISRLRAELARVKRERDILGKATAYYPRPTGRCGRSVFSVACWVSAWLGSMSTGLARHR